MRKSNVILRKQDTQNGNKRLKMAFIEAFIAWYFACFSILVNVRLRP